MKLSFTLNGNPMTLEVDESLTLLRLLRDHLGLPGTKVGCEIGVCGACSVLVDDRLTRACRTPVRAVEGRAVVTIEGLLGPDGAPSDLQRNFLRYSAVQCGYCTPGMIMAAEALLRRTLTPTREEIRQALRGNLCRCTGYQQIFEAIEATARERRSGVAATPPPGPVHVDGVAKVTGQARFVGDIRLPGMLYARVLRSPLPHARIVRLDTSPALQVPGVLAVITAEDFVDKGRFGWPVADAYALTPDKVRMVGDPIAAVAATSREAAQAGVAAILVEYEPLPVVTDVSDALKPEAPCIPSHPEAVDNLCVTHIVRYNDPQPWLEQADVTLEATYELPRQEHAYIETEAALAVPEPDGGVTVYANCQSPFIARDVLVRVLGLPPEQVRVIQPFVGGAFGGKDDGVYQTAAQAARLALVTGKPVQLWLSREESMAASYKREAMRIHWRAGATRAGELLGAHIEVLVDNGAYSAATPLSSWRATVHAAGAYRYKAVHINTHVIYTNNGYGGAFRGFGNPPVTFAAEVAIDELAHAVGMDPLAFRLQNALRAGDRTCAGNALEYPPGLVECLRWVREHSDWERKRAAYAQQPPDAPVRRGIGVACYFHGIGLGSEGRDYAAITLRIGEDNSVVLQAGLTDYGQGSRTVFSALAAQALGVKLERVQMPRPDTDTALESGPTVASRASVVGGNAVLVAARKLEGMLRLAAAEAFHCAPEDVQRVGEDFLGPGEDLLRFEEVVRHARALGLQLFAQGRWEVPHKHWDFASGTGVPYFAYTFGAEVVEVEVEGKTIRPVRLWMAHDGGKILFPMGAYGQMYGGIAQGLGYALMEDFSYTDGVPDKLNFNRYRIPRAGDMPDMEGVFLEFPASFGPLGAKNLAEPMLLGTAPALANAVFHATGVRLRKLPLKL